MSKKWSSLSRENAILGCRVRCTARAVLPDFCAPIITKLGKQRHVVAAVTRFTPSARAALRAMRAKCAGYSSARSSARARVARQHARVPPAPARRRTRRPSAPARRRATTPARRPWARGAGRPRATGSRRRSGRLAAPGGGGGRRGASSPPAAARRGATRSARRRSRSSGAPRAAAMRRCLVLLRSS